MNYVYKLTFSNGKIYIGISKVDKKGRFDARYNNHANAAKIGKDLPIYHAWRKHGAPTQEILSIHEDRNECELAEIDAIQKYDSMNTDVGYNLCAGGQGLKFHNNTLLYELMRKKVWHNVERNKKSSEALKGRKPSAATIKASIEWKQSEQGKAVYKKSWDNETRRKLASEKTKKQMDEGGSEHLSKIMKGRPDIRSDEGKILAKEKLMIYLQTERGIDNCKKGYQASIARPEVKAKSLAGMKVWRESEANKENCKRMAKLSAEKCSKKVLDPSTGIIYNSQKELALALNRHQSNVSNDIKKGKYIRV